MLPMYLQKDEYGFPWRIHVWKCKDGSYVAWCFVMFPFVVETYRSPSRHAARNGLAKKMWKRGWVVVR